MFKLTSSIVKHTLTAFADDSSDQILVIAKSKKTGFTVGSVVFDNYDGYMDWYASLGTLFSGKSDNGSKIIERLFK